MWCGVDAVIIQYILIQFLQGKMHVIILGWLSWLFQNALKYAVNVVKLFVSIWTALNESHSDLNTNIGQVFES